MRGGLGELRDYPRGFKTQAASAPIPHDHREGQVMAESAHPRRTSFISRRLSVLASRLRDPEWRRYGYLLFAGKALGIAVLFLAITAISGAFFSKVLAADAPVQAADIVNPI